MAFGLRELGFKAQMIGHTETGIATVVRDFLPARMGPEALQKFARRWITEEEPAAIDRDLTEQFCAPAHEKLGVVPAGVDTLVHEVQVDGTRARRTAEIRVLDPERSTGANSFRKNLVVGGGDAVIRSWKSVPAGGGQ